MIQNFAIAVVASVWFFTALAAPPTKADQNLWQDFRRFVAYLFGGTLLCCLPFGLAVEDGSLTVAVRYGAVSIGVALVCFAVGMVVHRFIEFVTKLFTG